MTRFATDPQNTFSLEKDEETDEETGEETDEVKEGERDERGRESENES